jgi:hypothetical protein
LTGKNSIPILRASKRKFLSINTLGQAYKRAVQFTGKVVGLVGITLAAGVVTWAFSPIKFQANMGILLTFMFLWNMIGALVLIPSLSTFLLKKVKGKNTSGEAEKEKP